MPPEPSAGCGPAGEEAIGDESGALPLAPSAPKWNANEFQCSICYELLLNPVVGGSP